jgi:hypothetical protein
MTPRTFTETQAEAAAEQTEVEIPLSPENYEDPDVFDNAHKPKRRSRYDR